MANFKMILQRIVAPGVDGGNARKSLTSGVDVELRYNRNMQLRIVADGLVAHLKSGNETLASIPFVPWEQIDELYEEKLMNDTLLDDDAFLDSYFSRFPENGS